MYHLEGAGGLAECGEHPLLVLAPEARTIRMRSLDGRSRPTGDVLLGNDADQLGRH